MIDRSVLDTAARLRRAGDAFLVATVVNVSGSSYRRPGARMVLTPERWLAGSVSGGCLEGDIVRRGWWRTREGRPVVVTYDSTSLDADEVRDGVGLGCDGVVEVMIERIGNDARDGSGAAGNHAPRIDPLAFLARCARSQRRGALATIFRSDLDDAPVGARASLVPGDALVSDPVAAAVGERIAEDLAAALDSGATVVRAYAVAGGSVQVLIEAVTPSPRLFVFGAGRDAVPLVALARTLGWDTIVCAPYARPATRERFATADELLFGAPEEAAGRVDASACALAVVMNHDYDQDRACVAALLSSRVRYIGLLGPRHRSAQLLAEVGPGDDERVHAPVGLALGAETPAEIGLAVVAEIQTVLTGATAARLRERRGPIHVRPVAAVRG